MPLQKLQLNPGINKEVTKYTNEAGWNDSDKIRFRQGYPEKMGGWTRLGANTFTGVCRSLHQWISLGFVRYTGLGTNVKFMVEEGQDYYDVTPLRTTVSLTDKIFVSSGSTTVRVQDVSGGFTVGSYITIAGSDAVGGISTDNLNKEHVIADVGSSFTDSTCDYNNDPTINHNTNANIVAGLPVSGTGIPEGAFVKQVTSPGTFELSASTTGGSVTDGTLTFDGTKLFSVTAAAAATSTPTSGGGGAFTVAYQINVGPDFQIPIVGWESSSYDGGTWNGSAGNIEELRVWNQANFGEDLIIGPRGGGLYYWDTSEGTGTRAVNVAGVKNGAPVELSVTTTGLFNTLIKGISSLDAAETAKLYVGQSITATGIPADTKIVSIGGVGTTLFMDKNPTEDTGGTPRSIIFGTNPISTTVDTTNLTVYDPTLTRAYEVGQFVTIAGCSGAIAGIPQASINARHKIELVDSAANTFTTAAISGIDAATSSTSGGGGAVTAQYELSAEVPVVQNHLLVSDVSRFVFCFGTNAFGDTTETLNPLLMRWSDQEDMFDWRPRSTNQSGDLQLSQGTEIVTAIQSRQEILVFTDAALYSLQYVGAPVVWSSTLVGSNMSVASSKAVAYANGVAYWMGKEKFYKYDGTVQPLRCDVRKFIFDDLDKGQYAQTFAGTLEEYHEIWWFYVSDSNTSRVAPDKYVVYNYLEDIWYVGTMDRSAWLDSPINDFPLAATNTYNLVEHENGNDDGQGATNIAIDAYITSGQFGIESGTSFTFVDKLIPDVTFVGSSSATPSVDMSLLASSEPGAANNNPLSQGGNSEKEVILVAETVDQYTEQVDIRVRGRQMAIKLASDSLGTKWQLGTPRLNMRPDGRRGS